MQSFTENEVSAAAGQGELSNKMFPIAPADARDELIGTSGSPHDTDSGARGDK